MTWENLTADADALRETLGFERWAALGHSFGGFVAPEYALPGPTPRAHATQASPLRVAGQPIWPSPEIRTCLRVFYDSPIAEHS